MVPARGKDGATVLEQSINFPLHPPHRPSQALRYLEDQALVLLFKQHLLVKEDYRVFPSRHFLRRGFLERQVLEVGVFDPFCPGKNSPHVRGEATQIDQTKLVLLRAFHPNLYAIHGPTHLKLSKLLADRLLPVQKNAGREALVHRGGDEAIVLGHELMQARRPAPKMAQDEKRGLLDGRGPDGFLRVFFLLLGGPDEGGEGAVTGYRGGKAG